MLCHQYCLKTIKGMYTGTVYEADKNGWFDISWEKYGTEVFEYEQADYKSSHAELTRFGISDCIIVDSEKEDSTIIVSGDKVDHPRLPQADLRSGGARGKYLSNIKTHS